MWIHNYYLGRSAKHMPEGDALNYWATSKGRDYFIIHRMFELGLEGIITPPLPTSTHNITNIYLILKQRMTDFNTSFRGQMVAPSIPVVWNRNNYNLGFFWKILQSQMQLFEKKVVFNCV